MKDFFISYNKADRAWAEWIAWQLEEAEYTVDIQAWDFLPGMNFILEMDEAARETQRTIAVLSPDYLTALYTKPEWAAAFAKDPTGKDRTLLPVRVRECNLDGLLGQIVYVDLVGLDEIAAKNTLLAAAKGDRAKPQNAPGYPPDARRSVARQPRFPGSLPDVWNIPHLRNPNFTGRKELLADLRAGLTSGQSIALTAINGLGGVGKTQLALEYAYRFASEYDIVWWVRSEKPETLASDYANLATSLNLPEKSEQDQRIIVKAVTEWLKQNRRWLLIFDNAPDADAVRAYTPRGNAGHVLVTSRDLNWGGIAKPLRVQVMPSNEAIEFIIKRTRQDDEAAAEKIAESLGCLPLALEQAAAYIEASGCTLSHYANLFQTRQKQLLGRGKPSTDYPDTVATTWNISFRVVKKKSEAAADLLKLCAFLAPDDIPLYIITEGAKYFPEPLASTASDPIAFDDTLALLRKYSLIEVSDETLSIHRLVQAVTQFQMNEDTKKVWIESAVRIVNSAFPYESEDVRTWGKCSHLLPHALTALSFAEADKLASEETGRLLNQAGGYLRGRAEFLQSKALHERALAIGEAAFGPDHPQVATFANNLGFVLKVLGDFAGARTNYERALAIGEAAFGPNHPTVAIRLNNLGGLLYSLGDFEGARANYERALAIDEATFGSNHPQVAIYANNLGGVLKSLGDLVGARTNFERAIAIDEAAFSPNHPNVAIDVNNLGGVLRSLGDLAGARAYYERALQIFRQFLGENHPYTIMVSNNLRDLEGKINEANQKEDSPEAM